MCSEWHQSRQRRNLFKESVHCRALLIRTWGVCLRTWLHWRSALWRRTPARRTLRRRNVSAESRLRPFAQTSRLPPAWRTPTAALQWWSADGDINSTTTQRSYRTESSDPLFSWVQMTYFSDLIRPEWSRENKVYTSDWKQVIALEGFIYLSERY